MSKRQTESEVECNLRKESRKNETIVNNGLEESNTNIPLDEDSQMTVPFEPHLMVPRQTLAAAGSRYQFEQQIRINEVYNAEWIRDTIVQDLSALSEDALQYHSDILRLIRIAFNDIDSNKEECKE